MSRSAEFPLCQSVAAAVGVASGGGAVSVLVLVTGLQGTGKSTIAERCADMLNAPVLAWDWIMAALTPFERVQAVLEAVDRPTYRAVGWAGAWHRTRREPRRGRAVALEALGRGGAGATTADRAAASGAG